MDFIKDLFGFLRARKKYWLFPSIVLLIMISLLVVVSSGSTLAPFIYSIF